MLYPKEPDTDWGLDFEDWFKSQLSPDSVIKNEKLHTLFKNTLKQAYEAGTKWGLYWG